MSFIVIKVYSFECDDAECGEQIEVQPGTQSNPVRVARRLIERDGWAANHRGEFCPTHAVVASVGEDPE